MDEPRDPPPDSKSSLWGAAWAGALTVAAIIWMMTEEGPAPASKQAVAALASPLRGGTVEQPRPTPAVEEPKPTVTPEAPKPVLASEPPQPEPAPAAKPSVRTTPAVREKRAVAAVDRPARPAPQRVAKAPKPKPATPPVSEEERMRSEIMARLEASDAITGHIGVLVEGKVVRLTGHTLTAAQAQRAEREVRNIDGVGEVRNEIRPRMSGSV